MGSMVSIVIVEFIRNHVPWDLNRCPVALTCRWWTRSCWPAKIGSRLLRSPRDRGEGCSTRKGWIAPPRTSSPRPGRTLPGRIAKFRLLEGSWRRTGGLDDLLVPENAILNCVVLTEHCWYLLGCWEIVFCEDLAFDTCLNSCLNLI